MRTRTLLLSAAALAAGLLSSQAQSNVYSANVVGYVTVVFRAAGNYTLVANPLDNGGSNNVVGLVDAVLPNKSQVLTWNPVSQSYVTAQKVAGVWNTNTPIPPGTGFFVRTPTTQVTDITNTFVGAVIVAPDNGTNTVALPAAFYLSGNPIPFNGLLNDGGINTINLGPSLPNKSQVLTWNANSQSYVTAQKVAGVWNTNLPLSPGQGYFIRSQTVTNWTEVLDIQ